MSAGYASAQSAPGSPVSAATDLSFDASSPTQSPAKADRSSAAVQPDFSTSTYARDRRALLQLLAKLHGTGIQDLLDLPQICVTGSQSVGKSSLIESIGGIKLPRESGTCTRCPMECRLEYSESARWTCRVSLRIRDGESVQELPFGSDLTDPEHVENRLRQAQRALLRTELQRDVFLDDSDLHIPAGRTLSFTDNCVCVHIVGPNVTDLHFYDLPGIIVNVQEGQDPSDINLVRSMVKRYIEKPGCIALLVVSCETDFENQVAGRLVREVDASGSNTVGVLTKPDKTDSESAHRWQKINDAYRLQTGWFVVKLPDSRELREGIAPEVARQRADAFFKTNEHWIDYAQRHPNRIGTQNLTDYLAQRLSDQLRDNLPRLREAVQRALVDTTNRLLALPPQLTNDPTAEVFACITSFAHKVSMHIRGTSPFTPTRRGLVQQLYASYLVFKRAIRATVPAFDAREDDAAAGGVSLVDLDSDDEETEVRAPNADLKIAEVMRLAIEARTRELPGNYPFSVTAHYIFSFLKEWEKPTFACFERAFKIFSDEITHLAEEHFSHYAHGGLTSNVQTAISAQLQATADRARARLRAEMLKETEEIYTQNDHYFTAYKAKYLALYKSTRARRPSPLVYEEHLPMEVPYVVETPEDRVRDAIRLLQRAGYRGATRGNLDRLFDTDEFDPAFDIMAQVRAYFQVAYKRYIDSIPQCIEQALVREFDKQLSGTLASDLGLFNSGARAKCETWVREPPAVAEQRRELLARKRTLEQAQALLFRFG
ncbi:hypothetical protein AURDEDRAFT_117098 [Auricularia subglabra TFB-10046 SS5]|uniref:P-loop containing nucleoside triphosphate hydrolase protein n=1 Tax=Auricularia subglabra (strain TFB-10046 / SS5) TaxID=717982 RepID=J0LG69_AURST|nr:hypothetical protein AURDEDRAFT_117098 [Auricularia subglabra TFB-10046 SS5]